MDCSKEMLQQRQLLQGLAVKRLSPASATDEYMESCPQKAVSRGQLILRSRSFQEMTITGQDPVGKSGEPNASAVQDAYGQHCVGV